MFPKDTFWLFTTMKVTDDFILPTRGLSGSARCSAEEVQTGASDSVLMGVPSQGGRAARLLREPFGCGIGPEERGSFRRHV